MRLSLSNVPGNDVALEFLNSFSARAYFEYYEYFIFLLRQSLILMT